MKLYYRDQSAGIEVHLGDCLEVLPTLDAVDHVITDPPYSEHVHSKSRAGSRTLDRTGFIADYSRAVDFGFDPVTEALRAGIAAIRAHRWTLVFSDVESAHLWSAALVCGGLDYVRTGAWVKLNGTPQFTGDRPGVGFEAVTICHPKGRKRWNGGGLPALWTHAVVKNHPGQADTRLHPTQKPIGLLIEQVEQFTDPGDLILDPFMGSGTTLVAAKQLGRRAIGVELEEKWAEVAVKRLEATTPPLFTLPSEKPVQGQMEVPA